MDQFATSSYVTAGSSVRPAAMTLRERLGHLREHSGKLVEIANQLCQVLGASNANALRSVQEKPMSEMDNMCDDIQHALDDIGARLDAALRRL